ncbi:hypothetical protein M4I21_12355 [Cellulophaga sp. 20_2_10]|uniref:hypothetical protein n=1 Tax=Cellulophaga sp. 20_2_10 TaxID=2942476 RepID=UPI00201B182C|nr:hypothetical protein [Cellulophaga sp. 20_2_10]MCL5246608.1 hypothetical protein [Cellulophaga sp. 20_2_10]
MKTYIKITLIALLLISCSSGIDVQKRNLAVEKYDLMNYESLEKPILMSVDDFFDGNNDISSIAPNLTEKPKLSEYYSVFKKILKNKNVEDVFVNIKDINIYENGKLRDSEWFFSDMIYIVGKISKSEVAELTEHLKPDEVEFDKGSIIQNIKPKYSELNVVYVWWD